MCQMGNLGSFQEVLSCRIFPRSFWAFSTWMGQTEYARKKMPYFRPKSSFMFYMVILGFHFKSSWVYLFFGTFDGHLVSVNSYVNWCDHDIRNYSKITVLWWKEPLATTVGTNFPTHKQTVEREGDCCSTRSVLGPGQHKSYSHWPGNSAVHIFTNQQTIFTRPQPPNQL